MSAWIVVGSLAVFAAILAAYFVGYTHGQDDAVLHGVDAPSQE